MTDVLNLVNPTNSIKYEISRFPDGQQSLRLIEENIHTFYGITNQTIPIKIKSRLNNFQDLELIICATQALRGIGVKSIELYIPYCMGARSDRKFMEGGINYVKHVIAPIINSQNYESVTVVDPHSDVLEACINNFKKIDNTELARFALSDYLRTQIQDGKFTDGDKIALNYDNVRFISPDAGALKKVFHVAEALKYKNEVIIASKHRNLDTGKIDYTNVHMSVTDADKDFFIFDDICDGGRTFIEIAKTIQERRNLSSSVQPKDYGNIYLVVTHGIFSAGLSELSKYFTKIYCTNSVKDKADINFSDITIKEDFIQQLNVF